MTTEEKSKELIKNKDLSRYFNLVLTNPPNILTFTEFFFETVQKSKFVVNWHHKIMSEKLNEILNCTHNTNHVIFNLPPRHTKTEIAVINFIALAFGINPDSEIMHLSASESLVTRNCSQVRKIMESEIYQSIFPKTKLTNNAKARIVTDSGGLLYSAPFLGQITGFGCGKLGSEKFAGAMIVDDPIKTQDALSVTIRDKVNFAWANTLISRKNDENTPVIVTAQRTHENDFCGYLIKEEGTIENGGKWDVVVIPAILDEGLETERALWDFRLSLSALKRQRELDKWVFDTQYMQNPKPIEGLLFHESTTRYYDDLPEPDYIHIQVDPADEGKDKTCSIVYYVKDDNIYIADIIYTADNSELTIPRIVKQIQIFGAATAVIESNSAWALFRKEIKNRVSDAGLATQILSLNQKSQKEIRIFNHAPTIVTNFYYPKSGNNEWRTFMSEKHSYVKMIKDQKDDGVDTDAAACAFLKKNRIIPII